MSTRRAGFERVLRTVALVASALLLLDIVWAWTGARGPEARSGSAARTVMLGADGTGAPAEAIATDSTQLAALLPLFGATARDTTMVIMRGVPSAPIRAALGSARAAGMPLQWTLAAGARVHPTALSVERRAGAMADAGAVVRASREGLPDTADAAGARPPLVLRDAGGVLDSLASVAPRDGVAPSTWSWALAQGTPSVALVSGDVVARAALTDTATATTRVLLVGSASWETRFTATALEEAGWTVDGRLTLSPTGGATIGAGGALDARRHAVVVVLDSAERSMPSARALAAFVEAGGGVVFAGDGLRSGAAASLAPAEVGALRRGLVGGVRSTAPRLGLDAWQLTPRVGALVLQADTIDARTVVPAVVVHRRGAGRVAAVAYRESWRWRMAGNDDGLAAHRAWWAAVVGSVARASEASALEKADPALGDAAPWADLVALAGPPMPRAAGIAPSAGVAADASRVWPDRRALLFVVAALSLVSEWASRRLRGLA